jgi:carbonic anhydrase/acetyltransferase-like protein (isoleucine patch superfamily)
MTGSSAQPQIQEGSIMDKKYELSAQAVELGGVTMHRIRAVRDFGTVKSGDLGGFVESERNLAHDGNAWVSGDARVSGNAMVSGDALVSGDARVFDNARVSGDALVFDNAWVGGDALVSGDARVSGDAQVGSYAVVSG